MSQEQLAAILKKGDTRACLDFFARLSEKERREYAGQALAFFTPVCKQSFIEVKPGTFERNPLLDAAGVAALSAGTFSDIKKTGWRTLPSEELAFEVLAAPAGLARRLGSVDL